MKWIAACHFPVMAVAAAVFCVACAPIGSRSNPIECSGVEGELEYLNRLRGPDSLPVNFERLGSVTGQRTGYIMYDQYRVESRNGRVNAMVYMNMHAGGFPDKPVEGFYLEPDTTMSE